MMTSAEDFSKFGEGFRSHYLQLCFFPLSFAQYLFICFPFISCTIVFCTVMIPPFVSASEWNKN